MAKYSQPHFWKQIPFFRLIIPLIAGILLQWHIGFALLPLLVIVAAALAVLFIYSRLSLTNKFNLRWITGICFYSALTAFGAILTWNQDIRHKSDWIGGFNKDSIVILATLKEPLVEKAKTFKALAAVSSAFVNNRWMPASGNMLLYISKDSVAQKLGYGSQVIFSKALQPIKNSGNPGSFNYRQFNAFQDIYHQVFLKSDEYVITGTTDKNPVQSWLFSIRSKVVNALQTYIPDEREAGVAEALLIGYRDNLDKDLVQAYSNTGVVHIIAISGLHLGLIYELLVILFRPFKRTKWAKWAKPLSILFVLWTFSLLAGGVPSILRSAVMFTFIVVGEALGRSNKILNTLAASAFVLLCFNPFYLWDLGFQLSYAAVVSIILFSKPIHNWFYIKNKLIDKIWEFNAVTIAAQILTIPIILYSFHQFPNLFLITNLVIVPLSTLVLYAELLLLMLSWWPAAATVAGVVTHLMLKFMNWFIEGVNDFPYAVYDGISINFAETCILYILICALAYWLLYKNKPALFIATFSLLTFVIIYSWNDWQARQQQKLIVYNIPQHTGMDYISGKAYAFYGDTILLTDAYLNNFHLKPCRTLHKINAANYIEDLYISYPFSMLHGKRVLVVDESFTFQSAEKIPVDVLVIAHNPKVSIPALNRVFNCKQIVFDASNSQWKINQWKKDCDSLHLRNFSTADEGAFVLSL